MRGGPISPLERIVLVAAGLAIGAAGMVLMAYAGPILRWLTS
jgi:hypothetical protein